MSIDTCNVCGSFVDTDEYPKAYRKKLDYKCVCDDCFDYYYTDKEEKHRELVTPDRELLELAAKAEGIGKKVNKCP